MKLYLIAGHNNTDTGAVALNQKEADLTKELRNLIYYIIKYFSPEIEVILDDDKDSLSTVINKINQTVNKEDIIIDIHFNAFNSKASGTEVFIPKVSSLTEKNLAKQIVEALSSIMKIPNRGIKTPNESARGSLGILKGVGNRILIEVRFMDNLNDSNAYTVNKYIIADKLAQILEDWIKANTKK